MRSSIKKVGQRVEVTVAGAVKNHGKYTLGHPKVLESLACAGGLIEQGPLRASGVVTVRRSLENRKVEIWRFDTTQAKRTLNSLDLKSGDLVVFQHQITTNDCTVHVGGIT